MKKRFLMLGMILLPTLVMAATPDFSGTWARDGANSDPVPNQLYWMTRQGPAAAPRAGGPAGFGGGAPLGGAAAAGAPAAGPRAAAGPGAAAAGGPRRAAPATLLTIHQDAKTLHVDDPQSTIHQYTLMADGASHTNPMDTNIQKAAVTAQFDGNNLVVETTEPFGGMPGNVTSKTKEVWSLSPDGKTLTITTTRDVPARHEEYKEVYTRTQDQRGAICSDGCVVPK